MHLKLTYSILVAVSTLTSAQTVQLASDPGTLGPPLEVAHLYYDGVPAAIAISRHGRQFSSFPAPLDANNARYQVAELLTDTTEQPFPNPNINSPPGGAVNYSTSPATGANYQDYLIGLVGLYVDPLDRLYILDTGRALTPDGALTYASYGGPKVVRVDLSNGDVVDKTFILPLNVAYPDSFLNDLRVDLRAHVTESGQGIAYITDSSNEGRNGIIILDLGTGESWRHLDADPRVRSAQQVLYSVWGTQYYNKNGRGQSIFHYTGADGIALTDNGDTLFWSPTGSHFLYSIPTQRLRDCSPQSELLAQAAVQSSGEKGIGDGISEDTNNYLYIGAIGDNAINIYNVNNATVSTCVRDPRIGWTDSSWIGEDDHLYFVENQLFRSPSQKQRPFALFKVPTADGGKRAIPRDVHDRNKP